MTAASNPIRFRWRTRHLAAAALAGLLAAPGHAQGPNAGDLNAASCPLHCVLAQLVETAGEMDGGDIYDPMDVAASTFVDVAVAQAKRGRLEQALDTLRRLAELPLLDSAENRLCVTGYTGVAEALAAAGQDEAADKLFSDALAIANSLGEPRGWTHAKIASALLRALRVEAAQEILAGMDRPEYRALVTADLAVQLAQSIGVHAARDMLGAAFRAVGEAGKSGQYTQVAAFSAIAKALVELGEIDEALTLVAKIEEEYERVATTAALATALQAAGHPAAARETLWLAVSLADAVAEDYHRRRAILAVVEGGHVLNHILPGDFPRRNRGMATPAEALRLKAMAEALDESRGGFARSAVAGALAKAGAEEAALELAAGMANACARAEALANIAAAQAAAGNIEDARKTTARIAPATPGRLRGCGSYDNALEAIAAAHAKRREFDAAFAVLPEFELADSRFGALMAIAEALAEHNARP